MKPHLCDIGSKKRPVLFLTIYSVYHSYSYHTCTCISCKWVFIPLEIHIYLSREIEAVMSEIFSVVTSVRKLERLEVNLLLCIGFQANTNPNKLV